MGTKVRRECTVGKGSGVGTRGRRTAYTTGGVTYAKSDAAITGGDVAIEVSLAKLDQAWQRDEGYYIPRGGGTDKVRYERAKAFLDSGRTVTMAQATYENGVLSFTDGRHRTAAARDQGRGTTYITVPRSQAAAVRRALGD